MGYFASGERGYRADAACLGTQILGPSASFRRGQNSSIAAWIERLLFIDLYSRMVVGWSMSERMSAQLVCDALQMALWRRHFPKRRHRLLGSGKPVLLDGLPGHAEAIWSAVQHERKGQWL